MTSPVTDLAMQAAMESRKFHPGIDPRIFLSAIFNFLAKLPPPVDYSVEDDRVGKAVRQSLERQGHPLEGVDWQQVGSDALEASSAHQLYPGVAAMAKSQKKALEFYATPEHWEGRALVRDGGFVGRLTKAQQDRGDLARKELGYTPKQGRGR